MTSVKTHAPRIIFTCLFLSTIPSLTLSDEKTILNNVNLSENDISKCIHIVMNENVPCDAFLNVIYSKTEVNKLIESINKYECYCIIIRNFTSAEWNLRNEFYLIMADDITELLSGLLELKRDALWNPGAKFIVTVQNTNDTIIQEIFQNFREHKMYNILLLNNMNNDTFVYTYYPFHNYNCSDYIGRDFKHLGNCLKSNISKKFPDNDFSKLHDCTLKAVKFEEKLHANYLSNKPLPILEQHILESFAQHFNFTIEYQVIKSEKDFGIVTPNGTVTGLLRYVDSNLADLAVGSTVIIRNRANLFDFLCGFNFASFQLYTSALGTEMWKKVYEEFDASTYLIIILFYCFMVVVCIYFLKATPKIPHSRVYLILKIWGFFYLGNGTEPYPKTKRLRSVTLCWIWFTFFISSFYNSDMYSLITGNIHRVRNIEPNKLSSLPYKPCIPRVIRTFFHYAYSEDLPVSFDPVACHSIDEALDTTANGYDLYTVQLKTSYTDREVDFIDEDGNRQLDPWDYGSDILMGFYTAKGLPYKNKLQLHAQYMYQSGLVQYYKRLIGPSKSAVNRRKKDTSKPFVLGDFRVHYAVLFVGSIISIVTFIVEIFYNRKRVTLM